MQYQEKTALPKGGAKTISDIDIKLISFVCALLWTYNQEEAWANNNWADVNCAVAIVSMAISMVSSGGATVKSFRAIRCRLLSPGSNPIHFTTNDYIHLGISTKNPFKPFWQKFCDAKLARLFEPEAKFVHQLWLKVFPRCALGKWGLSVPGAKNSWSTLLKTSRSKFNLSMTEK